LSAVVHPEPRATARLVAELAADAHGLPRWAPPRYYSARHNPQPQPAPVLAEVQAAYAEQIARLSDLGYFQDAFGSACIDAHEDPDGEGQRQLAAALGTDAALWPLACGGEPTHLQQDWPQELFYDVIEALHDLVARPRRRSWHDYGREWDYGDFARRPGQAVYRWQVNQLLDRSGLGLRLADAGSDRGRLVRTAGDARDQLVQQALRSPEPKVRDLVDHAVTQFRSRNASALAKREATKTLADVLEHRRALIKQEMFRGDEGALFEIANSFEIRHLNERQKGDYDSAFLDWVFWWYLATVELTDRLLARQQQLEQRESAG
jgi:hypothetical protein